MNNFNGTARLGNDPEQTFFASGRSLIKFSIAINCPEKDRDGNYKTFWAQAECWVDENGRGVGNAVLENEVRKGELVYITGDLSVDEWIDKGTDKKVTKPKIIIRDIARMLTQKRAEPTEAEQMGKTIPNKKPNPYASTASKGKAASQKDAIKEDTDDWLGNPTNETRSSEHVNDLPF